MNMIEKVARAMCRAHWPNEDRCKVYMLAAKAAIEAMREPTEEMKFALNNNADWNDGESAWQAAIDAALKE